MPSTLADLEIDGRLAGAARATAILFARETAEVSVVRLGCTVPAEQLARGLHAATLELIGRCTSPGRAGDELVASLRDSLRATDPAWRAPDPHGTAAIQLAQHLVGVLEVLAVVNVHEDPDLAARTRHPCSVLRAEMLAAVLDALAATGSSPSREAWMDLLDALVESLGRLSANEVASYLRRVQEPAGWDRSASGSRLPADRGLERRLEDLLAKLGPGAA